MATVQKKVRFFDTTLITESDERVDVAPDFWSSLIDSLEGWTLEGRSARVGDVTYFGRARRALKPALPHIQVERVRDLGEQLNVSNLSSGDVEPLELDDPNDRVTEPTFIVPFGFRNRVAVMSPAVQATRPETLARWLTSVLELPRTGRSVELTPVVDPEILAKIVSAEGAVMLEVHVDAGSHVPSIGGGAVGDAFRNAQHQSLQDASLTLRWSVDRSGGNHSVRDALRQGALWVARNAFSSRAEVRIVKEGEDGRLQRELHSIFDDRVTKTVSFKTVVSERTSDEVILAAIDDAILQFLRDD